MKATINNLFDTDREIITFDNSEFERPTSIADLEKCDNTLVGARVDARGPFEVMIDDNIYFVTPVKVSTNFRSMSVLEIV